ncbi:hypothetical protein FNW54_18530 [Bacteroides sp. HF-5092]|uniref:nitroreductase family protein n=1 Tax=Bacteroides TaxID=816 RepID=UPI001178B357|nr:MULTISPECIES: hypothetical protein [Bacteroides]TRX42650.1 hypothetical protein FNW54_18530 [Bacteroides sp. HF-5092]
MNDCTSATVNKTLATWSLGIGSCYVSRAEETFASEPGQCLMQEASIERRYKAHVCLCLGYPDGETGMAKPRKEGRVRYVL